MNRTQCVAWTLSALALVSATADAAITVTTVLPLISDICDACEAPQVRLPITVGGLPADKKLLVEVRDVSMNNKHDTQYRKALTVVLADVGGQFELRVTVAPKTLREDGTYSVALEFSAQMEDPIRTTLQLVRTAATFQPPGTLIVERVLETPWNESTGVGPPLTLLETSQRTGVADLQLVPK